MPDGAVIKGWIKTRNPRAEGAGDIIFFPTNEVRGACFLLFSFSFSQKKRKSG